VARFGRSRDVDESAGEHHRTRAVERFTVRVAMTLGIIGIGTALAAILATQDVAAWVIGLAVSTASVILAAVLWTRRAP
jgi:ABC-type anion transport system duplicated permease subunit